jgi:hypothetical protein
MWEVTLYYTLFVLYSALPLIGYSFYDYQGYSTRGKKYEEQYREEQKYVQVLISLIAVIIIFSVTHSWVIAALSLANYYLLWWFWYADLLFFAWVNMLKWYPQDRIGEPFHDEVIMGKATAWFTLVGLIITMYRMIIQNITWEEAKKTSISWNILRLQLIGGIIYIIGLNYLTLKYLK